MLSKTLGSPVHVEGVEWRDLVVEDGVSEEPPPCTECGHPDTILVRERGIDVTFQGVFAKVPCRGCGSRSLVDIQHIDKIRGINVQCPSCTETSFVPPSVWCSSCGEGLSLGWQEWVRRSCPPPPLGSDKIAKPRKWWQFWKRAG
jgi:ribosomal protein L37E